MPGRTESGKPNRVTLPERSRFVGRRTPWLWVLGPLALFACKGDVFAPAEGEAGGSSGRSGAAAAPAGGGGDGTGAAAGTNPGPAGFGGGTAGNTAGNDAGASGGSAGAGANAGASTGAAGSSAGVGGALGGTSGAGGKGEGGAGGKAQAPRLHGSKCDGQTPNGKNACGQQCVCEGSKWKCGANHGEKCVESAGAVCDSTAGRCLCRLTFTYCPPDSGEGVCGEKCLEDDDLYYACRKADQSMTTCFCDQDALWACAP